MAWTFWWIFPLGFFLFFLTMMVLRVVFWRRFAWRGWGYGACGPWAGPMAAAGPGGPGATAEEILARRLASGEIDVAEYRRLRDELRKP